MDILFDKDLFFSSALKNFATTDLYSFILSRDGNLKRRLFVYIPTKEFKSGFIPIHCHKYLDKLTPIYGEVDDIHFVKDEHGICELVEYKYARLSDENHSLERTGKKQRFLHAGIFNKEHIIEKHVFHTVIANGPSAWLIEELEENELYEGNFCYSDERDHLDHTPLIMDVASTNIVIELLKEYNINLVEI